MNIQLTIFFQILIFIIVAAIIIKLIQVVFRIARSLEGIDDSLKQINEKKSKAGIEP